MTLPTALRSVDGGHRRGFLRPARRVPAALVTAVALAAASAQPVAATTAPQPAAASGASPRVEEPGAQLVRYEITDLGTLGGELANAHGINDRGEVTGISETPLGYETFLWRDGRLIGLGGVDGAPTSQGFEISETGQVTGYAMARDPEFGGRTAVPFHWAPETGMRAVTHDFTYSGSGYGRDINTDGVVVGSWRSRAFMWSEEKGYRELGVLPGSPGNGEAHAVNDQGVAVGYGQDAGWFGKPVRWGTDGTATELPVLEGGQRGEAIDINSAGLAVGSAEKLFEYGFLPRPVLWHPDGAVEEIPLIPAEPALDMGTAEAVSEDGTIIGWDSSSVAGDGRMVGWIRTPDGEKTALVPQIDPGSGWSTVVPTDLNNLGQIVGLGILTRDGVTYYGRALLMTPVAIAARVDLRQHHSNRYADLTWEPVGVRKLELRRNGVVVRMVNDDGHHSERIGKSPDVSDTFQLCVPGTEKCSAELTATSGGGTPAAAASKPVTFLGER